MSKIDKAAATLTVNNSGMFRMDDVLMFQLVRWDGELYVQVKDWNRPRCNVRGNQYIMVPLDLFVAKLVKTAQRFGG